MRKTISRTMRRMKKMRRMQRRRRRCMRKRGIASRITRGRTQRGRSYDGQGGRLGRGREEDIDNEQYD
jgi:hypothetical protein